MKKLLSIVLASLMVLGLAATAFAIHAEIPAETQAVVSAANIQITLGGEIRTRGWWRSNLAGGLGQEDVNDAAWWDERVRLSVDAVVAPGVEGFVQIETQSNTDGDKYTWGHGSKGSKDVPVGGRGSDGAGGTNSKPETQLDILQAWIVYSGQGLFGFNSGLKIGHMPLKLAYGQFFDNTQYGDDALVLFMSPVKGLELAALTFKGSEGTVADNTNDLDAYVGLATYKWDDKNTVGINYTYINQSDSELKLQDLGLHADGSFGAFGYKAAADIQFGSVTHNDADFGGYAINLAANYDFNSMNVPINLRGSFVYGSGDNDADDNDLDEFLPFVGNIQNYSFIYEYQHATTAGANGGFNVAAPSDGHAAGVANTTYVNLGIDWNATKDLVLSSDVYGFWASKTGAFEDNITTLNPGENDVSSNAGWEIDAKMKYKLAKNLIYQIDAGYFKPGGFYRDAYDIDTKGVTALRHSLTLSF